MKGMKLKTFATKSHASDTQKNSKAIKIDCIALNFKKSDTVFFLIENSINAISPPHPSVKYEIHEMMQSLMLFVLLLIRQLQQRNLQQPDCKSICIHHYREQS